MDDADGTDFKCIIVLKNLRHNVPEPGYLRNLLPFSMGEDVLQVFHWSEATG